MVKHKKDATAEERILAAAREVFISGGLASARMQEIADRAGINKALLHYYFKNKEKLFETIFLQEAKKFFPQINMIFESDDPLFEKIEKFADLYLTEMIQNPYLPWFVLNEINQDPERFFGMIWDKTNLPRPRKFLEQVEKEVKNGRIKPIQPVHLLVNLLSLCIFPFVAKPMIIKNLGVSESQFRLLMEQRKKEIPKFILDSIKK
jgi:TetR/AcrR family transcriptional regulator